MKRRAFLAAPLLVALPMVAVGQRVLPRIGVLSLVAFEPDTRVQSI